MSGGSSTVMIMLFGGVFLLCVCCSAASGAAYFFVPSVKDWVNGLFGGTSDAGAGVADFNDKDVFFTVPRTNPPLYMGISKAMSVFAFNVLKDPYKAREYVWRVVPTTQNAVVIMPKFPRIAKGGILGFRDSKVVIIAADPKNPPEDCLWRIEKPADNRFNIVHVAESKAKGVNWGIGSNGLSKDVSLVEIKDGNPQWLVFVTDGWVPFSTPVRHDKPKEFEGCSYFGRTYSYSKDNWSCFPDPRSAMDTGQNWSKGSFGGHQCTNTQECVDKVKDKT